MDSESRLPYPVRLGTFQSIEVLNQTKDRRQRHLSLYPGLPELEHLMSSSALGVGFTQSVLLLLRLQDVERLTSQAFFPRPLGCRKHPMWLLSLYNQMIQFLTKRMSFSFLNVDYHTSFSIMTRIARQKINKRREGLNTTDQFIQADIHRTLPPTAEYTLFSKCTQNILQGRWCIRTY